MSRETFMVGTRQGIAFKCNGCLRWHSVEDMQRAEQGAPTLTGWCQECWDEQDYELHSNDARYDNPRQPEQH